MSGVLVGAWPISITMLCGMNVVMVGWILPQTVCDCIFLRIPISSVYAGFLTWIVLKASITASCCQRWLAFLFENDVANS